MLPDFRVRQRDYLLEIAQAITQELDTDKLLVRVLRLSAEMLAGQAGLIALRKENGGWYVAASHDIHPALLRYLEPLLENVPRYSDVARFEIPEINRLLLNLTRVASFSLSSGVGLPMIAMGRVVGVIFIFRGYSSAFSQEDRVLLQSFADQAAIAVNNAQLYTETKREKQRLNAILNSAADGILILTAGQMIEDCNMSFVRMLKTTAEKVKGYGHDEIIQWVKVEHGLTLGDAVAGGWPLTPQATLYIEGDIVRNNMVPLPVGITYVPLLSAEGSLVSIIATVRDISRFREADELKSTFVSVISHELKTPVALIKGYVSTLRREDAVWDREVVDDSLQIIEEEADRLTVMIENLLDASRLQAGGLPLKPGSIAIDRLVRRIVDRMQTQSTKHTIAVELPDDMPLVMVDEDRIEQVITNLILNAIKYSPDGGKITVKGDIRRDFIMVCVEDEGLGVAGEDIPFIFDRFYRSRDVRKITKGAGLGLYLARAVIEAHQGRIWVDSTHKKGAKICFSLPR